MIDLRRAGLMLFLAAILVLSAGAFAPLWIDKTAVDPAVDGSPALQAVWATIYLVVAALLVPHAKNVWRMLFANPFVPMLLVTCLISAAWSENAMLTLRKSVALFGTTLVGTLLAVNFEEREQVGLISVALGMTAIASLVVGVICPERFPATEFAPAAWNGVFSHKNLLGRTMSLGALSFVSAERRRFGSYLFSWGGAALCFGLLLASHSQTALLVSTALTLVIPLSSMLRWKWRFGLGSSLVASVLFVPMCWLAIEHLDTLFYSLHRDGTLTGRARIWSFSLLSFFRQPWTGYGYGAFWWVSSESRQALALIRYPTPHAHNGFLDLGLQLGFAGLAIFVVGWMFALLRAVGNFSTCATSSTRWPIVYLLFLVFYSFTENSLLSPNSLLWILYVAACCGLVRHSGAAPANSGSAEALPS